MCQFTGKEILICSELARDIRYLYSFVYLILISLLLTEYYRIYFGRVKAKKIYMQIKVMCLNV